MDSSVLYPPNSFSLSDDVIGVKPRARKRSVYVDAPNKSRSIQQHNSHRDTNFPTQDFEAMEQFSNLQAKTIPPNVKKITLDELRSQTQDSSLLELILLGKEMERERRCRNQKRYRKKQDDHMNNLQDNVRQLEKEIMQLQQLRTDLCSGAEVDVCMWNVVVTYFKAFRYRFFSEAAGVPDGRISNDQLEFIRAKVSPNVMFNAGFGLESLLRSWSWFSFALQNFEMELGGLEKESSTSMIATTRTSFTLTERTMQEIFPHLSSADAEFGDATLLQQLVGKSIVVLGRTRFEWNGPEGKVTSIMAQSDFLTPVLRLVSSLKNVSRVFDKSRISPEFVWKL